MTLHAYPFEKTNNSLVEVQQMLLEPPRILRGLVVTAVGTNKIRVAEGAMKMAGMTVTNTSDTPDITVTSNLSSTSRTDRLVMRSVIAAAANPSGYTVTVTLAVVSQPSNVALSVLPTTLGVGTYEVEIARWTIGAGLAVVTGVQQTGPMPGAVLQRKSNYGAAYSGGSFPANNTETGVTTLTMTNVAQGSVVEVDATVYLKFVGTDNSGGYLFLDVNGVREYIGWHSHANPSILPWPVRMQYTNRVPDGSVVATIIGAAASNGLAAQILEVPLFMREIAQ